MHRSGPPAVGAAAGGALTVTGAARRAFDGGARLATDPGHTARHGVYLTDLLAPYGLAPEPGALAAGRGQSYGEMAQAVIAAVTSPQDPVDLLVLAFAGPDIAPGRATATYLSHVCPGAPLAFAICDQGAVTGFTGLRLISEYVRSGDCRSALLVIVEQAELHYVPPAPVAVPAGHTAVALLCRWDPDAEPATARQHTDVAPAQVGTLLTGPPGGAWIVGAQLAAAAGLPSSGSASGSTTGSGSTTVADPGRPTTGVWWELAGLPTEHPAVRRAQLADYDPQLRRLGMSTVELAPAAIPAVPAMTSAC